MGEESRPQNFLVSVSDMMAGLLFVFMIVLMGFVYQAMAVKTNLEKKTQDLAQLVSKHEQKTKALEHLVSDNSEVRGKILTEIWGKLENRNLVTMDHEVGVLRLGEAFLPYPSGSTVTTSQDNLQEISIALLEGLKCYVGNIPEENSLCTVTQRRVEALFIEGHTDNVPLGKMLMERTGLKDNRELSTIRAVHTYNQMLKYAPGLAELKNDNGWPVVSVAGYGEDRPVKGHEWNIIKNDPVNRRIDIRIIMAPFTQADVKNLSGG